MTLFVRFLVLLALWMPVFAESLDPGKLIERGVLLHDQKRYAEAIASYREALRQEPTNPTALYELAFSLSATGDFDQCVQTAKRARKAAKRIVAGLFALEGNCLDSRGSSKQAAKVYRRGLAAFPDDPDLAYNFGVSEFELGQYRHARQLAKVSIQARPNHPSSHLLIAKAYAAENYRVPALYAALRFLSLEPAGPRAEEAAALARANLNHGVSRGADAKIEVLVDPNADKDEGDFNSESILLSLLAAGRLSGGGEQKAECEQLVVQLGIFLAMLEGADEEKSEPKGRTVFARATYLPFLTTVQREGVADAFGYRVFAALHPAESLAWTSDHRTEVDRLEQVLLRINGGDAP